MLRQVFLFCLTLPWVVMFSIDVIKDMTVFRQCVHKEQCDTPLAELKPYGSLLCFTKCLQLSSHVRLNSKTLVCGIYMASQNVSGGKTKDSESDKNWTCRKKVPNSECQPRSRCVKSRSGETKCVHFDIQEHLQRKDRTSTQPGKHSQLFNITERDLKDNWTTTEGPGPEAILSLTWSPSFDNELYGLRREEIGFVIALYMPIGNSLEKQVRWVKVLLPRPNGLGEWTTIDTGLSQTNDTMYCIYLYSMRNSFSDVLMRLRSYREVKIPRHLELEREWDITQKCPTMTFSFMFACDAKLRMALYAQGLFSSTVQKFLIQAG